MSRLGGPAMHVRRTASVFVAFAASLVLAAAAQAEARFALVIGNANYTEVSPLANPVNDVELVAEALRATGFEVTALVDADQPTFENAVRSFAAQLSAAGEDAVGLFYFAGHGVQHNGQNYLIPVNAPITAVTDLRYRAVAAEWVLGLLEEAENSTNIMVLDACRNNPFRSLSRAARGGLTQMNAPSGSYIVYSTAPRRRGL